MTKEGQIAVLKIKIESEMPLSFSDIDSIKREIRTVGNKKGNQLIKIEESHYFRKDKRLKPRAPSICKECAWLKNGQCWYNNELYRNFRGDFDVCFKPLNPIIDKQKFLVKYYRKVGKSG